MCATKIRVSVLLSNGLISFASSPLTYSTVCMEMQKIHASTSRRMVSSRDVCVSLAIYNNLQIDGDRRKPAANNGCLNVSPFK